MLKIQRAWRCYRLVRGTCLVIDGPRDTWPFFVKQFVYRRRQPALKGDEQLSGQEKEKFLTSDQGAAYGKSEGGLQLRVIFKNGSVSEKGH